MHDITGDSDMNTAQIVGAARLEADTLRERVAELEDSLKQAAADFREIYLECETVKSSNARNFAVTSTCEKLQRWTERFESDARFRLAPIPFPFTKEAA